MPAEQQEDALTRSADLQPVQCTLARPQLFAETNADVNRANLNESFRTNCRLLVSRSNSLRFASFPLKADNLDQFNKTSDPVTHVWVTDVKLLLHPNFWNTLVCLSVCVSVSPPKDPVFHTTPGLVPTSVQKPCLS